MVSEYNEKGTLGRFVLHDSNKLLSGRGLRDRDPEPINTFVYNKHAAQQVKIDGIFYTMPAASILPLVSNQNFQFERPAELVAWQFNRAFYCILNHDKEVGCVGFLFYGIHHPMFIELAPSAAAEIEQLSHIFSREMEVKDNFQGEMLRTLLKRVIIQTTRIAKQQCKSYQVFPDEKMDLIRKFALILEGNFKKEHAVKFYAAALNKSPKTLSNTFAILMQPAPSVLIRNRIILEAKRYLYYTDKSAKEIAYDLGFESPAHFSRFFKQHTGSNISEFNTADPQA